MACAGPTHVCWLKAAVPRETRGLPAPHQTSQPRVLVPGRDVPATSGGGHSVCTTGTLLLGGGRALGPGSSKSHVKTSGDSGRVTQRAAGVPGVLLKNLRGLAADGLACSELQG